MPSRDLPARPNLDHLKNEAKALQKSFRGGDTDARERVRRTLGESLDSSLEQSFKLTDAQRVVAREYGFLTWVALRAHVQASRSIAEAIDTFLAAVQAQDLARAKQILRTRPRIASESLHVAAALGLADEVKRWITAEPSRVRERAGNPPADPLLFLGYSPFHGDSAERDAGLLASAQLLLDAGADPNTKDERYGVPVLYAVTGMRSVLPIARLLLDAGANPTDGESVYHAAEYFHEDALKLLLDAGADLNATGEWGNTPLTFLLRWFDVERQTTVRKGLVWLLDHGADPNVRSGKERESALHVAVRRGQHPAIIRLLLERGADIHSRRDDGSTPWLLARRGGLDEIASLLESAGAEPQPLSNLDLLLGACGRGDADAARRLTSPELVAALSEEDLARLPEAAAERSDARVTAYLAAGFPADATDGMRATALHHGAIHGRAAMVRALLAAGARVDLRDSEHSATPLGWATFGVDYVADSDGDYEGSARALLEAGARLSENEAPPKHVGVRALLHQFGETNTQ
jgi:FOG: Ankyrin repeat